jgi:hypothetical protein
MSDLQAPLWAGDLCVVSSCSHLGRSDKCEGNESPIIPPTQCLAYCETLRVYEMIGLPLATLGIMAIFWCLTINMTAGAHKTV